MRRRAYHCPDCGAEMVRGRRRPGPVGQAVGWTILVFVLVGMLFSWHLFVIYEMSGFEWKDRQGVEFNPVTNVLKVEPPESGGAVLWSSIGFRIVEDRMQKHAREKFDIYAMVIRYEVIFR